MGTDGALTRVLDLHAQEEQVRELDLVHRADATLA